ncbi:hypothetical protein BBAL3_1192 [Brevundimonas sp. BAL3]|jgi:hypothetical protein|nr:hypothetical protein BBAL3_1192 [Brevundimonas sp. BAL3]
MAPGEAAEPMSELFCDQARFDIYFRIGSGGEKTQRFQTKRGLKSTVRRSS